MDDLKVSVILPVYNCEKYIKETLNSIILQDFDSFELIIIDDGSTDNSLKIIKEFLDDSIIPNKILTQENHGVSYTRNRGIMEASGEFIVFVDDDDLIKKNHISCLYKAAQNHDGAFTKMLKIDDEGNIIGNIGLFAPINGLSEIETSKLIDLELDMAIPFSFCQIMYKKELLKANFNSEAIYGEDTEFLLKNLIYTNSIGICSDVTYFYIQRKNSATDNANLDRFDFIEILENLAIYYNKNNKSELSEKIEKIRIPKAIFGNLMYFFYNDYNYEDIMSKMEDLELFDKLNNFNGDLKFKLKTKLFLLSPKIYYKTWKRFKNNI